METIEIKRWSEFRDFVDNDQQILPVYWRGQKDPNWALASAFERQMLYLNGGWHDDASQIYPYADRNFTNRYYRNGVNYITRDFYESMRDRYLSKFKRSCSGLRGDSPAELDDDQWWALGRHFGLITPLLDWTTSPYIAAFFPLNELYKEMRAAGGGISFEGKSFAVYRLFKNKSLEGDGLSVLELTVDELGRLQSQRGLFTWLDSIEYFELQGFLDNTERSDLLHKFIISDQVVLDALRDLKAHGIDWNLLFPDLFGAANQANTHWDIF